MANQAIAAVSPGKINLNEKIKIKFGEPHHGWLPVSFVAGEFVLDFDASDVPENPLYHLIDAIYKALVGLESEIWWHHLEPAGYYFSFEPKGPDECVLKVTFTNGNVPEKTKKIFETNGSFSQILFPFWRGVKEFNTHNYSEPHWPGVPAYELQKLTTLINEIKKG